MTSLLSRKRQTCSTKMHSPDLQAFFPETEPMKQQKSENPASNIFMDMTPPRNRTNGTTEA